MLVRILVVAVGGAFGAVSRYLLSSWIDERAKAAIGPFPLGTLAVNVLGSFLLGLLMSEGLGTRSGFSSHTRLLLGVGFLGSLTTFSTFSAETLGALRDGEPRTALLNVAASLLLTLGACWLGLTAGGKG